MNILISFIHLFSFCVVYLGFSCASKKKMYKKRIYIREMNTVTQYCKKKRVEIFIQDVIFMTLSAN